MWDMYLSHLEEVHVGLIRKMERHRSLKSRTMRIMDQTLRG